MSRIRFSGTPSPTPAGEIARREKKRQRHTQEAFQVAAREREAYISVPLNILAELRFGEGGPAGRQAQQGVEKEGDRHVQTGRSSIFEECCGKRGVSWLMGGLQ